jgi:cbb3-type cytochrome oxidase cytochrome c subunit
MSELLSKVAEILKAPEELVQRSAEARAEASGKSVDEVLQSWAGGEAIESSPAAETPVEEAPVEEVVEEAPVEEVVEEAPVEVKKESSFVFISGVIAIAIFTYFFGYLFPKQQSENLVSESLNNTIEVSNEELKGAEIYNQLNCQSCHTQNVRVVIPDSQNGKVLKNKYAEQAVIQNTGLTRIGPDLSNSASREPTNNPQWLSRYLKDSSSVRENVPHPNYDFLNQQDLDYLITYLLSLGESNE